MEITNCNLIVATVATPAAARPTLVYLNMLVTSEDDVA